MVDNKNAQTADRDFVGRMAMAGTEGGKEVPEGRTAADAESEDDAFLARIAGEPDDEDDDENPTSLLDEEEVDGEGATDDGDLEDIEDATADSDDADAENEGEGDDDLKEIDSKGSGTDTVAVEYATALAALKRDGWAVDDLKALPKERVVALGLKRLHVQKDVDAHHEELVQLRNGAGRTNPNRENEAEATESNKALTDTAKKLAARLGLGEDGAGLLAEFGSAAQAPLLQSGSCLSLAGDHQLIQPRSEALAF